MVSYMRRGEEVVVIDSSPEPDWDAINEMANEPDNYPRDEDEVESCMSSVGIDRCDFCNDQNCTCPTCNP